MSATTRSANALALKAFRRIREVVPKRNRDLLIKMDEVVDLLSSPRAAVEASVAEEAQEQATGGGGEVGEEEEADKYFPYFQAACESGEAKVMELALDGLHALIEYGYLRGMKSLTPLAAQEVLQPPPQAPQAEAVFPPPPRTLMDSIIEVVCKCSDEFNDGVQLQVIKVLLTAVTSSQCQVNESSLLLAIRACFHIHLISKSSINKVTTKAALTQMVNAVNAKMEASDVRLKASSSSERLHAQLSALPSSSSSDAGDPPAAGAVKSTQAAAATPVQFASVQHKDSFLLFRALCKLSMKGLHDDAQESLQADAVAMQNKILSLELILHILLRSGPAFKSGERFVYVIRHYLCVSLLGNCTSHIGQVTDLSLQIFVALLEGFKDHLKSELEVFFTNVFLRILESENSTYEHKLRVLEVFHSICRDPKTLAEIFINYDCDLDAIDLFKRIVDGFARTVKTASSAASASTQTGFLQPASYAKTLVEEQNLRKAGLEGFVTILRSLMRSRGLLLLEGTPSSNQEKADPTAAAYSEPSSAEDDAPQNLPGVDPATPPLTPSAVTTFDKKQRVQEEMTTGILKFNLSSKKGLAYLANANHIQMTAKSVAAFFHQYEDRLDKAVIGDFLGREKEFENGFCIEVLHEYVEMLDFAAMEFDLAIRHFLQGFRLPGEAQKIDRIMEKFAERFYLQNQDKFASADMAFILAFSTIMLQTNLHNPAIREDKRMTKEEFIKQNTKISEDGELSVDMLMDIYDRIAAQPISMTQDDKLSRKLKKDDQTSAFGAVFQFPNDKRRIEAFSDERKEMVRAGEAMFRKKSRSNKAFLRQSSPSHDDAYLSPMFEVTWAPVLGVFSQILETYDEPSLVSLCLTGFEHALRLSCRVDNTTCRSTYVNGLIKFTALGSVREMRQKHIECIKVLITIALTEGDFLEDDWVQVLQSISQLARLQLFAMKSHPDDVFFGNAQGITAGGSAVDSFTKYFSGPTKAEAVRSLEEANAGMIVKEISSVAIDQIFLNSQNLSDDGVQHFVRALCAVSLQEITSNMNGLRGKNVLDDTTTPRIFSLQKLVEVADFNMPSRSRIAWTNMWDLLAQHFTSVGIHENHHLAMYAIDSLKQLSIKFLQKEELSNFNFQRVFLRPFEFIMTNSPKSPGIKDLILRCIDTMISHDRHGGNIRSGWRTIFSIFEAAAGQENMEISRLAFQILETGVLSSMTSSASPEKADKSYPIFDFADLLNCLVKFIAGSHTAEALKALGYLSRCAAHLASASPGEDDGVFRVWWPMLLGLSTRVSDARLPVRLQALETLHEILRKYSKLFSRQAWAVIFRGVLLPIMDSAKTDTTLQPASRWPTEFSGMAGNHPGKKSFEPSSWIGTMAENVLSICLDLFLVHSEEDVVGNGNAVLPDLLMMLEDCVCQDVESLAVIGVQAYKELVRREKGVRGEGIALLCMSISRCVSRNLCFRFGPLGSLAASPRLQAEAINPAAALGFFVGGGVGGGAEEEEDDDEVGSPSKPRLSATEAWKRRASTLMTSMVVTLGTVDLVGDLCESHGDALTADQYSVLLSALEVCYWHARSFNEDEALAQGLAARSFMAFSSPGAGAGAGAAPHLLEQEAASATKIVCLSMGLYLKAQAPAFIEPWIQRYCSIVCNRYMDSDVPTGGKGALSLSASSAAEYRGAVLVVLQGLQSCSLQQFQAVISQSISRLILSSDFEIRQLLAALCSQHSIFS